MPTISPADATGALPALQDMLQRSRAAQAKFAPGTAQHTLQANRIHALETAAALLQSAAASEAPPPLSQASLLRAAAPLASLLRKSEKAQTKLAPGTWQHTMLETNIHALRLATPLLAQALAASGAPEA